MRRPLLVIAALAALVPLMAARPSVAQSADETLLPGGQPLILGKVTRITSHSVIMLTRDGETLPIEFDSRTVMSTTMPTGCRVRVEFRLLDSGRYLAQRITPLEPTSNAWAALSLRRPARSKPRVAAIAPAVYAGVGSTAAEAPTTDASPTAGSEATAATTEASETDADASVASAEGQAPSASGPLPLILVISVLALAGSIVARRIRGRLR